MCARSIASWALLRAVRRRAMPWSITWSETCSLPRVDAPGIYPWPHLLPPESAAPAARSGGSRSTTRGARVLLAAPWFISPSESIYLELGSSSQTMILPRACQNYPVLGTHFLSLSVRLRRRTNAVATRTRSYHMRGPFRSKLVLACWARGERPGIARRSRGFRSSDCPCCHKSDRHVP
jgi:hypothetical protein